MASLDVGNQVSDILTDEELVAHSAARAEEAESRDWHMRAFSRESSVVCLCLSAIGLMGLIALLLSGFHMYVGSGERKIASVAGKGLSLVAGGTDLTGIVVGITATAFAGGLILCGGAIMHIRRMPPMSAGGVVLSAILCAGGLALLALGAT